MDTELYCFWVTKVYELYECLKLGFSSLQPLADAEGADKPAMVELLKSHGGLSYVSSHFSFNKRDPVLSFPLSFFPSALLVRTLCVVLLSYYLLKWCLLQCTSLLCSQIPFKTCS